MLNQELIDWIAHDQSDYAQRVREAVRPILTSLAQSALEFGRWNERLNHRHIMRRKIRRMVFGG